MPEFSDGVTRSSKGDWGEGSFSKKKVKTLSKNHQGQNAEETLGSKSKTLLMLTHKRKEGWECESILIMRIQAADSTGLQVLSHAGNRGSPPRWDATTNPNHAWRKGAEQGHGWRSLLQELWSSNELRQQCVQVSCMFSHSTIP